MSELNYHTQVNDAIKGEKIILEARNIKTSKNPVKGSHRHRTNRAEGRHNAIAWVEIEVYTIGQFTISGQP